MPCLEPDKNLSREAKELLILLGKIKSADKQRLVEDTGFAPSLVARKLRELIGKEAVKEEEGVYSLTSKGEEAISALGA